MPVEIKELQVRVTVNDPPEGGGRTQGQPAPNASEKEAIINECIEQVMEILNSKKER